MRKMRRSALSLSASVVLILLLSLTTLVGANAPATQTDPSAASSAPVTEAELNDTSIPPLSSGAVAGPKAVVPVPPATPAPAAPAAPLITVWYGPNQTFGPHGDPQKWVNIVGKVTSGAPLVGLSYTINGGPSQTLSIGPNSSRLIDAGDFNIELDYTDLLPGNNSVVITATDNTAGVGQTVVNVNYQAFAGNWTPGTYTINWAGATKVNDVAQVVDGQWNIESGKARAPIMGFDRLIAVGDLSWRDYTVTVPVTINNMVLSKNPGIGIMVRWQGHFDAGNALQPVAGWRRLGAMGWYRYEKGTPPTEGLQLLGHGGRELGTKPITLTVGQTYIYKLNVTSSNNPSKPATYSFKMWNATQAEPAAWDIVSQGASGEPRSGSLLLVAHHTDASFGNVVVELNSVEPKPELTISPMGTGSGAITPNPQKAAYRFGEDVALTAAPNANSTFGGWQGDASGTANPTSVQMFGDRAVKAVFINPNVATPISDDFNGCGLNNQLWTFINPAGDATLTMNGGQAEIAVPAGSAHDIWTSGRNAPRIMQFAENDDFEFDVKFDSPMSAKNQAQGVLIEGDEDNFLRYNFLHDGSSYRVQAFTFVDGAQTEKANVPITITPPMYLRVKRVYVPGSTDVWNLYYSGNGTTWSFAAGFSYSLAVSSYGVYAGNSGPNPAFVGKVDYFFNTDSPIAPEDALRKLNVATTGSGTVERSPNKENYACDETVTLTPVPAEGFKFGSWSGDLTGTANPGMLVMNATKNVTANFVADVQYTVTTSAVGAGTVTKSPDKAAYSDGEQVTLTATPNLGNLFVNWSGDASGTTNPLTITVNGNKNIVGNFATAPPRVLTVTTNGNGTVTANPPGPTYLHGQSVTLTAVPAAGASFVDWAGAATGATNPVTIVMDADKGVTANFKDNVFTLSVTSNPEGSGSVTTSPTKPAYYDGEVVTLTPVPNTGFMFAGWGGDLTGNANPGQLTMTKNSVVTANFIPSDTFTVNITLNGSGSVLLNPSKPEYTYGEQVSLTAMPGAGYEFVGWDVDLQGSDNPATITVTQDMNITAIFGLEGVYSLTILAPTNGSITVNPVRDLYAPNENVTLTAVPALGYMFTGWGGDATGTTNPFILQMTGNKTVSATFEPAPLYNLTVSAVGPGSVAVDPPGTQFIAGTTITLTATAQSGYVFTGWSGNAVGNNNPLQLVMDSDKSITATFEEASEVISDDFDGCAVLSPMWTWSDPLGQADYSVTGSQVQIVIPPGVNYDIWKDGNNSARLMQEVANTNFELFVRFDSPLTAGVQTKGVLIEMSDSVFLRADFMHDGTGLRFFAGTVSDGVGRIRFNEAIPAPATPGISMRVQRNGDQWKMMYRVNDADPWIGVPKNSFKFAMNVERVGVFAASQASSNQATAPGHTALFDYFFNAAAPIAPEDANAPGITVTKVGQGTVSQTPPGPAYTCGQQVQLTATPATGWEFLNWSGGLNGVTPTQTLTVSGKHAVTATFVPLESFQIFLPAAIR